MYSHGHCSQLEFLDIYLPLLVDTSPQTSTSIAQLLGAAIRYQTHRRAVTEWLPRADRMKEVKGKRGWEKSSITNVNAPSRQGGWVARNLTALLRSRDSKVRGFFAYDIICDSSFFRFQLQEAALSALAALSKDNTSLAVVLAKSSPDRDGNNPVLIYVYIRTKFCSFKCLLLFHPCSHCVNLVHWMSN
jgi:armadillo repeat-containing protein 8